MQLSSLRLTNYRACRDTEVQLAADLTVLVGENASGKSAVIDALRHVTFPASGRTTAWFAAERDLNRQAGQGEPVTVTARYSELTEAEKAIYLANVLDAHEDLVYSVSFATAPTTLRRDVTSWSVGDSLADDAEPALRRRLSHVYLPPLRDAVRDIDGADQTQLYEVLRILLGTDREKHDSFVEAASTALGVIADHPVAAEARDAIQTFFTQTTPPNREHRLALSRRELELRRIARLLRLQLAEHGLPVGDIASTGMGYANLLYISMIVLQLTRAQESDLTLLLVEEPEAHLHPQLQLVLLDFLQQQAQNSAPDEEADPDAGSGSGRVQVVVTTHSPVLASTVSVDNVVVVARDEDGATWSTRATALSSLGLKRAEVRKIDRYLNSTRSALLFARDVVLVEGIAEMLLLPALASYHLAAPPTDLESVLRRRRQFRSATIVSVEGVDFAPYLRLLLEGDDQRVDRVVVVTDGDNGAGEHRRETYEALHPDAAASGRLHIVVGPTTLEAEVFRHAANEQVLREAFEQLRPGSLARWDAVATAADGKDPQSRAELFAAAIRGPRSAGELHLDISKGDFAHLLAEGVATQEERIVVVPDYLRAAIELVAHVDAEVA